MNTRTYVDFNDLDDIREDLGYLVYAGVKEQLEKKENEINIDE